MCKLTPAALESAYEFFRCTTKQFKILPHADEVEFRVTRRRDVYGHFTQPRKGKRRQWVISISDQTVGHTITMFQVMAHEMVHLHQAIRGTENKAQHNDEFLRIAAAVATQHGFDPRAL